MDREEILRRAQLEGGEKDERYKQTELRAGSASAKLALLLCVALEKSFEELFYLE